MDGISSWAMLQPQLGNAAFQCVQCELQVFIEVALPFDLWVMCQLPMHASYAHCLY
jgi:hypothetical protein